MFGRHLLRSQALLQNYLTHFLKSKWHLAVKLKFFTFFIFKVVLFTYQNSLSPFKLPYYCTKKPEELSLQPCFCSHRSRTACMPVVLTEYITYTEGHPPWLTTEYIKLQIPTYREEDLKFSAPVESQTGISISGEAVLHAESGPKSTELIAHTGTTTLLFYTTSLHQRKSKQTHLQLQIS